MSNLSSLHPISLGLIPNLDLDLLLNCFALLEQLGNLDILFLAQVVPFYSELEDVLVGGTGDFLAECMDIVVVEGIFLIASV